MTAIHRQQCAGPGLAQRHLLSVLPSLLALFTPPTPSFLWALHTHQVIPASGPLHGRVPLPETGQASRLVPGAWSGAPSLLMRYPARLAQNMRGMHSHPLGKWGAAWRDQQVPGAQ